MIVVSAKIKPLFFSVSAAASLDSGLAPMEFYIVFNGVIFNPLRVKLSNSISIGLSPISTGLFTCLKVVKANFLTALSAVVVQAIFGGIQLIKFCEREIVFAAGTFFHRIAPTSKG